VLVAVAEICQSHRLNGPKTAQTLLVAGVIRPSRERQAHGRGHAAGKPVKVLDMFRVFLAPTGVARRGLRGQANVLVDHAAEAWAADDWPLRGT
jgi:hypothetical protein